MPVQRSYEFNSSRTIYTIGMKADNYIAGLHVFIYVLHLVLFMLYVWTTNIYIYNYIYIHMYIYI